MIRLRSFAARMKKAGVAALVAVLAGLTLWSFGAIHFDAPFPGWPNTLLAVLWLALLLCALQFFRKPSRRFTAWLVLWLLVWIPWSLKKPSHDRDWPAEFARVASADVDGDEVTIRNFRSFDYVADGTPVERWATRKVRLSNLRGMDFFMTYWGDGTLVGHPIFSFDFGTDGHVTFSIESRREKDEMYSLLGGLYKRYEMIYVVGDESDIIRLRTNFREREDVYLYRLHVRQSTVMLRFMEYLDAMNRIDSHPRFYDTLTGNCTTAIRAQITTSERNSMDWRIFANGKLDELFFERDMLTKELPFAELKQRSLIKPVALAHPGIEGFSAKIRENLPGFGPAEND